MHGSAVSKSKKKLVSVWSGGLMNVDVSNLRMTSKLGKLIKMLILRKRQLFICLLINLWIVIQ
jgi:hypothetical protein